MSSLEDQTCFWPDENELRDALARLEYKLRERVMIGDHASFKFRKQYSSFEALKPGEKIAKDKTRAYVAPKEKGLMMLMPSTQDAVDKRISRGAYYLMQRV